MSIHRILVATLAVASLALCSCGSRSSSDVVSAGTRPQTSPAPASDAPEIVLDDIQQQKGHVVVERVRTKEVADSLTIPGRLGVNEDQTWHIGAVASGKIENISARVGDFVMAGQVLGLLHSHEVHEARAGYQEAVTELRRAQAAETYAQQRRDRAQRLFELRAGSRQDLETAEADLRNAQAATQKALSEVEKEHAHLTIFNLPVEETAGSGPPHDQEDEIKVLAPASGLVFERKATVGSVVNSGDELFAVTDTSSLWMIAAANEVDLSQISVGRGAHIEVRAYPGREFSGTVLKLGEKLDPDTRTLQIRILVPNPQGQLKPEMYATASLRGGARRSGLFVPDEAVQELNGVPSVFVRRAQTRFEARPVRTGQDVEGEAEILEGLNAGDSVVVRGSFLLKSQMLKSAIQDN
jgi:multidrug efflux pump subunit AcrA (membrane-fusion protein)